MARGSWLLLLVALPGLAQEPSFEAIAARYLASQTYCDAGKRFINHGPPLDTTHRDAFERCGHRDGRFKYVEDPGDRAVVNWSDGEKHHRYFLHNRLYQQRAFTDNVDYDLYRNRSELYPVFLFRFLVAEPRELTEKERRTKWVQSFKHNPALSTAEVTVFENPAERMHVRNADRMIVRHERVSNGTVTGTTELARAELDRPLGAAELSYDAPLTARFSPQSNGPAFVAILFVSAGLLGFAMWAWLFRRAQDPWNVIDGRRRLWKFQLWALLVVVVLLGILAVVTSIGPQSGHPPAIVYVWLLAVFAAIGFGLVAGFTLASYPVQWLFRTRLYSPRGN